MTNFLLLIFLFCTSFSISAMEQKEGPLGERSLWLAFRKIIRENSCDYYVKVEDRNEPIPVENKYTKHMPVFTQKKQEGRVGTKDNPFALACELRTFKNLLFLIDQCRLPSDSLMAMNCNANLALNQKSFHELISLINLAGDLKNDILVRLIGAQIPSRVRTVNLACLKEYKKWGWHR